MESESSEPLLINALDHRSCQVDGRGLQHHGIKDSSKWIHREHNGQLQQHESAGNANHVKDNRIICMAGKVNYKNEIVSTMKFPSTPSQAHQNKDGECNGDNDENENDSKDPNSDTNFCDQEIRADYLGNFLNQQGHAVDQTCASSNHVVIHKVCDTRDIHCQSCGDASSLNHSGETFGRSSSALPSPREQSHSIHFPPSDQNTTSRESFYKVREKQRDVHSGVIASENVRDIMFGENKKNDAESDEPQSCRSYWFKSTVLQAGEDANVFNRLYRAISKNGTKMIRDDFLKGNDTTSATDVSNSTDDCPNLRDSSSLCFDGPFTEIENIPEDGIYVETPDHKDPALSCPLLGTEISEGADDSFLGNSRNSPQLDDNVITGEDNIVQETRFDESIIILDNENENESLTRHWQIFKQKRRPPMLGLLEYHVFFLHHTRDRDWVWSTVSILESSDMEFRCCCSERDFNDGLSWIDNVINSIRMSRNTILVLTDDFISDTWPRVEGSLTSAIDITELQRTLLGVKLQECNLPVLLGDVPLVDVTEENWWNKLISNVHSNACTPTAEGTTFFGGLNPALRSGHLLHSSKSSCRLCVGEVIDCSEVPIELNIHGIQVPAEEYEACLSQLMAERRFHFHTCFYNRPVAVVVFTALLGICLTVIPLLETRLIVHDRGTGLEYVHACLVWLCVLTSYIVIMYIAKKRLNGSSFKRLANMNKVFIKYNILTGIENLGIADCNKYYIHFFYYEIGPCLSFLQELVVTMDESKVAYKEAELEEEATPMETDAYNQIIELNDTDRVLGTECETNATMQTRAEDLLLDHSGEYINLLITKKLDRPHRQRHVKHAPCLCQFVEQRVFKMIV